MTHAAHLKRSQVFVFRRRWCTTSVIERLHRRLGKIIEALSVGKARKKIAPCAQIAIERRRA